MLEHNRLDLLTLAALTARLLHLAHSGPDAIGDAREALALGHVYARGGLEERARDSYRRALERCRSPRGAYDPIRIEALRALALACRRARRFDEAASSWARAGGDAWLSRRRSCAKPPKRSRFITNTASAIWRWRERFALGSLAALSDGPRPSLAQAVRHRLARIERKMSESAQNGQLLD